MTVYNQQFLNSLTIESFENICNYCQLRCRIEVDIKLNITLTCIYTKWNCRQNHYICSF